MPQMNEAEFRNDVAEGVVQGGMIPMLEKAIQAIAAGVKEVVITKASHLGQNDGTHIF